MRPQSPEVEVNQEGEFRRVKVLQPSFPLIAPDAVMEPLPQLQWQVLCGDFGHWRAGVYSPAETSAEQLTELEQHSCPELFLLLCGRLVLLLGGPLGELELELEPGKPVLISRPHAGYCPDGPHTGAALVVERDVFETEYRDVEQWR